MVFSVSFSKDHENSIEKVLKCATRYSLSKSYFQKKALLFLPIK